MNESPNEAIALRPLWWITLGAVAGAGSTVLAPATGPAWLPSCSFWQASVFFWER